MLDRLVDGLFDYAGMYPPASLAFDDALRRSAAFPRTLHRPHLVHADMVAQTIHLAEMDDKRLRAAGFEDDHDLRIAVVGVPLGEADDALALIQRFDDQGAGAVIRRKVVSLEVTSETMPDAAQLDAFAAASREARVMPYLEPRWAPSAWATRLPDLLARLHAPAAPLGLKFRCAGPTALDATTVAQVLAAVGQDPLPLKATQGLHHPLVEPDRHRDPIGFLGLTLGLRMATTQPLEPSLLIDLLTERDPNAFAFDDAVTWRGHTLAAERLEAARTLVPFQIGSCSLDEPDDDLRRLFG